MVSDEWLTIYNTLRALRLCTEMLRFTKVRTPLRIPLRPLRLKLTFNLN